MKLVIHAGFQNTGAWAFQAACTEARAALAGLGVCYPDFADVPGVASHADVARVVARGDGDALDRLLGALAMQGIVRRSGVVLLSADEFSAGDLGADAVAQLRHRARECFDAVEFVVLVRSPESLARSLVRSALPHFAYAFWNSGDGQAGRLAKYAADQQARFRAAVGDGLREVSYDAIAGSPRFCNAVLRACVPTLPEDVAVLPERWGDFDAPNLDPYAVFAPLLRAAVAKSQGTSPYAPSVQAELEQLLPRAALGALVASVDMPRVSALITRLVETTVANAAAAGGLPAA